jgi:hypothetical protein
MCVAVRPLLAADLMPAMVRVSEHQVHATATRLIYNHAFLRNSFFQLFQLRKMLAIVAIPRENLTVSGVA